MGTRVVRRIFLLHQHEKEEAFLNKMHLEGWQLKGVSLWKYTFEPCVSKAYSYQLEFVDNKDNVDDYHQLFEDAGWEEITSTPNSRGRWFYFRKPVKNGNFEKIFSDQQSKLDMIKQVTKNYVILLIILLPCLYIGFINPLISDTVPLHMKVIFFIFWCSVLFLILFQVNALRNLKRKIELQIEKQI